MEALRLVKENVDPGEAEYILGAAFSELMQIASQIKRVEISSDPDLEPLIRGVPGNSLGIRGISQKIQNLAFEINEEATIFFDPVASESDYKDHGDLEE